MKTLEKIFNVMMKNLEYTIVLVICILLFAIFAGSLLAGLITAASALIAYICIAKLYKEFKKPSKGKK